MSSAELCRFDVEVHLIQCTGAFEVYTIECEEAFLYERPSIGDDGISGRLSDDFDAHTGFDEYAVGVFTHFSGDNESWHNSKYKKNKTIDAMPVARFKEKSKGANRKALLPGTGIGKHLITEGTS